MQWKNFKEIHFTKEFIDPDKERKVYEELVINPSEHERRLENLVIDIVPCTPNHFSPKSKRHPPVISKSEAYKVARVLGKEGYENKSMTDLLNDALFFYWSERQARFDSGDEYGLGKLLRKGSSKNSPRPADIHLINVAEFLATHLDLSAVENRGLIVAGLHHDTVEDLSKNLQKAAEWLEKIRRACGDTTASRVNGITNPYKPITKHLNFAMIDQIYDSITGLTDIVIGKLTGLKSHLYSKPVATEINRLISFATVVQDAPTILGNYEGTNDYERLKSYFEEASYAGTIRKIVAYDEEHSDVLHIVKLCDILHNLGTRGGLNDPEKLKQQGKNLTSLHHFAPLVEASDNPNHKRLFQRVLYYNLIESVEVLDSLLADADDKQEDIQQARQYLSDNLVYAGQWLKDQYGIKVGDIAARYDIHPSKNGLAQKDLN